MKAIFVPKKMSTLNVLLISENYWNFPIKSGNFPFIYLASNGLKRPKMQRFVGVLV